MPIAIALLTLLVGQSAAPQLSPANFELWKARLSKVAADSPHLQTEWMRTLPSAMRAGIDGKKPILLWLERGHPLAMTSTHGVRMRTEVLGNAALREKLRRYACAALSVEIFEELSAGHALDLVKQIPVGKNATHRFEGFVLFAPTGKMLGATSSLDPAELVKQLEEFEKGDPGTPPADYRQAWLEEPEDDAPATDYYIRFLCQDLPRDKPSTGWEAKAWNAGYLAFDQSNALELTPEDLNIGESRAVDEDLVKFFGRYAVVDAVRGMPTSFLTDDVKVAQMTTTLEGESRNVRTYSLVGRITASTAGEWSLDADNPAVEMSSQVRGIDMALRGRARYDMFAKKLVSLEIVAVGPRWGGSPLNGRRTDTRASDMGVLISLVEPKATRHIPTIMEDD